MAKNSCEPFSASSTRIFDSAAIIRFAMAEGVRWSQSHAAGREISLWWKVSRSWVWRIRRCAASTKTSRGRMTFSTCVPSSCSEHRFCVTYSLPSSDPARPMPDDGFPEISLKEMEMIQGSAITALKFMAFTWANMQKGKYSQRSICESREQRYQDNMVYISKPHSSDTKDMIQDLSGCQF